MPTVNPCVVDCNNGHPCSVSPVRGPLHCDALPPPSEGGVQPLSQYAPRTSLGPWRRLSTRHKQKLENSARLHGHLPTCCTWKPSISGCEQAGACLLGGERQSAVLPHWPNQEPANAWGQHCRPTVDLAPLRPAHTADPDFPRKSWFPSPQTS